MKHNQIQSTNDSDWLTDYEGQLAVDVYQTESDVILTAPIAGVDKDDLEISITDEVINIKGERRHQDEFVKENFYTQECYWGAFSRSYILPIAVDAARADASLKNGILTIKIPKLEKSKTKLVEIKVEE